MQKTRINIATGFLTLTIAVVALFTAWKVWSIVTSISLIPGTWVGASNLPQIRDYSIAGHHELTILHFPLHIRVLSAIALVCGATMTILLLNTARQVSRHVALGNPFSQRLSRTLKRTGISVAILAGIRFAVDALVVKLAWDHFRDYMSNIPLETAMEQQVSSGASFNLPAVSAAHLLAALVCIVLATAFERGRRLEEDVDGLV